MPKNLIYLETYVLQQDMRIRMPKTILSNMNVEKGISKFDLSDESLEKEEFNWIKESTIRFKKAFQPRCKQFYKNNQE